jgi:hypothetical protein
MQAVLCINLPVLLQKSHQLNFKIKPLLLVRDGYLVIIWSLIQRSVDEKYYILVGLAKKVELQTN